jgi:hypothetical protein
MTRLAGACVQRATLAAASALVVFSLSGGVATAAGLASRQEADPPLPRSINAKVTGKLLVVRYCFRKPMPTGLHRRPFQLNIGVDNYHDHLPPLVLPWRVRKACGTIRQPTGAVKKPFSVTISVTAPSGNRSRVIRVRPTFLP